MLKLLFTILIELFPIIIVTLSGCTEGDVGPLNTVSTSYIIIIYYYIVNINLVRFYPIIDISPTITAYYYIPIRLIFYIPYRNNRSVTLVTRLPNTNSEPKTSSRLAWNGYRTPDTAIVELLAGLFY